MDRRKFLHNIALLTAGVIAADQLEILERLTWKRKYFSGIDFAVGEDYTVGYTISTKMFENDWYVNFGDVSNARVQVDFSQWRGVYGK